MRMIQQADIGVGISGREGLQAARAADYSIGSEFLNTLLLFFRHVIVTNIVLATSWFASHVSSV